MTRHSLQLSRFHEARRVAELTLRPIELLQPVQGELLEVARSVAQKGEEVSPSRLSSLSNQTAEAGVYLRSGPRRGAVVHLRWSDAQPGQVQIEVAPLSHLQVVLVWCALGASLLLGLLAGAVLPIDSPEAKLLIGLGSGIGLGISLIFAITNSSVGSSPESKEMAERLGRAVDAWRTTRTADAEPL